MNRTLTALLAVLALPLAACDSFYVEAEQPLACLTLEPQTVTIGGGSAPIVGPITQTWPEQQQQIALGDALPSFLLDGRPEDRVIRLVSFGMQITTGVPNLNWIKALTVSVSRNGGTPVQLANCQNCVPAGATSVTIPSTNTEYNLADVVDSSGNLTLSYGGTIDVPAGTTVPTTFGGRVNLCVSARVKKTFNELTR
ncbi:MAG: hypothetical protein WB493_14750 [Anaeromyxobacteraceae bacterium]